MGGGGAKQGGGEGESKDDQNDFSSYRFEPPGDFCTLTLSLGEDRISEYRLLESHHQPRGLPPRA